MANIDDLLSSIKAEQTGSQQPTEQAKTQQTEQPRTSESAPLEQTRSVEDLLGQLEGHPPQESVPHSLNHSTPSTSALNALLAHLPPHSTPTQSDFSKPAESNPEGSKLDISNPVPGQPLHPSLVESFPKPLDLSKLPSTVRSSEPIQPVLPSTPLTVLEDLKSQYLEEQRQREAQERAEQERLRQEQEAALAQQRQAAERQAKEKQDRIEKAAQAWLSQLQPLSGEAIWFDEFASHYPSRLAAAIDYLNLED